MCFCLEALCICIHTFCRLLVFPIFAINITQDSGGSRTITWFPTIKWDNSVLSPNLTTTPNKRDTFVIMATGTVTFDGFIAGRNL